MLIKLLTAALDNIPAEVWLTGELLDFCNKVYQQDSIDRWTERCILPSPKKGDLSLTTNYRGITSQCNICKGLQPPSPKQDTFRA